MSYLFDYGEFLLCFAPVFLLIAFIFAALVWNNLPSREVKKGRRSTAASKIVIRFRGNSDLHCAAVSGYRDGWDLAFHAK